MMKMLAMMLAAASTVAGHNTSRRLQDENCANIAGDGDAVDVSDLLALLAGYGGSSAETDVNSDGTTDVSDLLLLLAQYGTSCTRGAAAAAAAATHARSSSSTSL